MNYKISIFFDKRYGCLNSGLLFFEFENTKKEDWQILLSWFLIFCKKDKFLFFATHFFFV